MRLFAVIITLILLGGNWVQTFAQDVKKHVIRYTETITDTIIDEKTSDVLRTIGWDLPLSGAKIKCDDISDSGIGSAYSPHTFSIADEVEGLSDCEWKFLLRDKTGAYTEICKGTELTFTIPKIESESNYLVNVNGDLEGRIECDYTMNGQRYSAQPFALSLELKPVILSIDDLSIVENDQFSFYVLFNVRYAGADYISVYIEEEYDTGVTRYIINEPYIAHVKTCNISNLYYSWITIKASNKYGSVEKTLEFEPTDKGDASAEQALKHPSLQRIQLYNLNGCIIFDGSQSEFVNQSLHSGIYLKKDIYDNGLSKTTKYIVK